MKGFFMGVGWQLEGWFFGTGISVIVWISKQQKIIVLLNNCIITSIAKVIY